MSRTFVFILGALAGCSSLESHFRTRELTARPKKILIESFESRSMKYNPYVVKNLRDSLRFEFFKRGYEVSLSENRAAKGAEAMVKQSAEDRAPEPDSDRKPETPGTVIEKKKESTARLDADACISGALFEAEIGEIADTQTSTMISFVVYDRAGGQIGEGRFLTSKSMIDAKTVRKVARRIAAQIHSSFPGN